MGAGTSKSLRSYLLHDWSPQVDVPERLETEARKLARLALRQAEAHAPQHRRHLHSSQPRPPWMDPTLLHVAVAGSSPAAVDAVLAALACATPLAEVVSEEAESGPLGQAFEIGLRCFAFLDSELRILRLWVVLHTRELSGTALGLSRFDLLLWVQGSPGEAEAEELEEDDLKRVMGAKKEDMAKAEDPLLKESISVDILDCGGAGGDAEAGPESTLFTLSPSSVFDQDSFGPTFGFSDSQILRSRGEDLSSDRQGPALEKGSALSTGPLPSFVPKPTFLGDHSSDLASEPPDILTKFGSSPPVSPTSSCTTLPPVDGDEVVDELTNALPAEECQSQAACSSLQGASVESSSGMTGGSASVESSSGLTKGSASHTSSVSDLVLQVYQEMEGGVSLERLQELNRVLSKECIAEESESAAVSQECSPRNESALVPVERNECALVPVDQVDTLAKLPDESRRRELEEALEQARAEKQRAAQAEDYDAAHEAKEREKAILAELESFNIGMASNSQAAAESRRRSLEEALQRARAEKQRACEVADYDAAHEAKEREKAILAELEGLTDTADSKTEQERLEEQLRQARAAKQAASEAEDYDAAYEAKELENRLLAELELLRKQTPRIVESPTVSKGAARWSCIAAAADTSKADAAGHGRARAAESGRVPRALRKLAGWADGRPPLLVTGESGEVLEAVRSMLPEAGICELPGAALEEADPQDGSQLMRMRGFWVLLETSVRVISSSRAFSDRDSRQNAKEDFGDGLKRGSPVRLCHLNIEALRQHNGKSGMLIGMDKKGYLIRLWDDEVIQVVQNNMTHLKFKLTPPSPVMLTQMDRWIVKLKGLQSKPELNGQEGTTEPTVADSGRHNVRLKDGTVIAAKDANFEVLERDRPELEGCVGLLDGYQLEEPLKYKVLLVNPAQSGRVRLKGLVQKPELNGREGTIIVFKVETQRYQVALSGDGFEVNVKRVNMDFLQPQRITARVLSLCPERVDYWLDPDEEETLSIM